MKQEYFLGELICTAKYAGKKYPLAIESRITLLLIVKHPPKTGEKSLALQNLTIAQNSGNIV